METKTRIYPTNPLGIIATFVFFIEAIAASTLHFLKTEPHLLARIVNFIIVFPSFIAIVFFGILIFRREILFAPGDFKDEDNFVKILSKLELGQRVSQATISPPSNIENVISLVDELIERNEFRNVIRIGRGYLKIKEFSKAKKFFEYVKEKISSNNEFYFKVLANIAYAEIGLGEYLLAFNNLKRVEAIQGEKIEIWQLATLAYALNKLGHLDESLHYLERTKGHVDFLSTQHALNLLYPDYSF